MSYPSISVVIPVYGSERFLAQLWKRLELALGGVTSNFEVIFVDDASRDRSWECIMGLARTDKRIKGVRLFKNRGQQNAVLCGFSICSNDVVITMDADLQHRPEEISVLVNGLMENGADVAIGKFRKKQHSFFRNLGTLMVKYLVSKSIGISSQLELTSFRAIRKETVLEVLKLHHPRPVIGFILYQVTDRFVNVNVKHDLRDDGGSSYSYFKLIRYFFTQIIEYSELPLTIMSLIGAGFALSSFAYGFFIFLRKVMGFSIASGFTTLVLLICFFGGITLLSLGIIGRYLSRVLRAQGFEPTYIIREKTF